MRFSCLDATMYHVMMRFRLFHLSSSLDGDSFLYYDRQRGSSTAPKRHRIWFKGVRRREKLYISRLGDSKTNSAKIYSSFLSFCDSKVSFMYRQSEENRTEEEYMSVKISILGFIHRWRAVVRFGGCFSIKLKFLVTKLSFVSQLYPET